MQIQVCCFQQFVVVVPALAFAPFGIPAIAFWIYVSASLVFIIGLIKIFGELPQEHGVDKILPFGRLFFAIPRFFLGLPSLFYGVEHLLHPEYVPGIPLQKLTPDWIPGRILLSYFVGLILILAGVCLLVNKKTRMAATSLGLTILLTVLWIYLPMLLAAPKDVVALNFFFDALLFCGTILLLANAIEKK